MPRHSPKKEQDLYHHGPTSIQGGRWATTSRWQDRPQSLKCALSGLLRVIKGIRSWTLNVFMWVSGASCWEILDIEKVENNRSAGHSCLTLACWCGVAAKSCLTFLQPMDCRPPVFSVHGISLVGTLEQIAISYSRGFPWPRDRTCGSCIGRRILYHWAAWKAPSAD